MYKKKYLKYKIKYLDIKNKQQYNNTIKKFNTINQTDMQEISDNIYKNDNDLFEKKHYSKGGKPIKVTMEELNNYMKIPKSISNSQNEKMEEMVITNDNLNLVPVVGKTDKVLKFNFPEISIASVQYNEGPTGSTYIRLNVDNANYYMDSRGGAVNTYASDQRRSNRRTIRGICFSGGSIIGLEAKSGCVIEEMKKINYTDHGKCNVTGATLRSANLDYNYIYPDKNLGRFAVNNLKPDPFKNDNNNKSEYSNEVYLGQVGVGCMAGDGYYGQGAYFKEYKGIKIFVLTGVNALGAIYNEKGEVLRDRWALSGKKSPYIYSHNNDISTIENTTLTVVITDLTLNLFELQQLAIQCHTNMAVVIRPFHTIGDGDVLFSVTLNKVNRANIKDFRILEFYDVCSQCAKNAVLNCF